MLGLGHDWLLEKGPIAGIHQYLEFFRLEQTIGHPSLPFPHWQSRSYVPIWN